VFEVLEVDCVEKLATFGYFSACLDGN